MSDGRLRLSRRALLAGLGAAAVSRPSVAQPGESAPDGFRVLRARRGVATLRGEDHGTTAIWGYDGVTPGPVLRTRRGEEFKLRLVNELPEPTAVHWHGLRIPNAMDGVPHLTQAPIEPGKSFDYRFTPPDAGTFWYHAHLSSSEQMERGLAGALIVDETTPVDVDRDLMLLIDDWRLTASGEVDERSFRSTHDAAHEGRIGEHVTVNGRPSLTVPVRTNERLRLRIVNAANARVMPLRLERHDPVVVAIDGQPAEPFAPRNARVVLGPGNRVDLFVDMTLAAGASAALVLDGERGSLPLVRFAYADRPPSRPLPRGDVKPLPPNPLPARMDLAKALRVDAPLDGGAMRMMGMGGGTGRGMIGGPGTGRETGGDIDPRARVWTLAGKASSGHQGPPLFSVKRGRTVTIAMPNRTAFPHAMHLHGHHFRLLDNLDDGWKPYWLDTVLIEPQRTARIAFVADNPGKWMIHCHMLEHQETGMAAWFEVI